jgi:hypothetical protein
VVARTAAAIAEEERQRRLAEMMGNADEHATQRRQRLDAAAAAEVRDERLVQAADTGRGGDAFKDAASRDVYRKLQDSATLEARISSRRHYSAR